MKSHISACCLSLFLSAFAVSSTGALAVADPLITPPPGAESEGTDARCTPAPCPSGSTHVVIPYSSTVCGVIYPCPGIFTCVASGVSVSIPRPTISCTPSSTPSPTPTPIGAPLWGQCGGQNWSGPTVCREGVCVSLGPYFSKPKVFSYLAIQC